jgi:ribosomal protein S12 methylthiotransferase
MTTKELKQKKVGIISLGCDKNRVDTEHILGLLTQYGFSITNNIEEANIILVNTCSFIHDAKEESIAAILESVGYKQKICEKVIVLGCFNANLFINDRKELPLVDAFVKIKDNKNIIKIIEGLYGLNSNFKPLNLPPNRIVSTPRHYAYLKIADGCNNACTYCTIPAIRGKYVSEPIEALLEEAKGLVNLGVKELILVAQDVTRYGLDLYKEPKIVELIQKLSKIEKLEWIRLHYCYPEMVSEKLIKEIANNDKVCKYIDIPLQHINDEVLFNMNRKSTKEGVKTLIKKIRAANKNIAIRSTFIVGFPGETRKQFKELYNFLKEYKLNYVGFFTYSKEPKTVAYNMKKQVPQFIKNLRLKKVQKLQASILNTSNIAQIGTQCIVLCESIIEHAKYYVARREQNSPEVDAVVYIKTNKSLKVGEFYTVKITNVLGYDLEGKLL